ncbi:MAG: cytochrome ubiquinol oxidase subunit I [Desulfovibrionaceae bacterium]|jgi:cytochrome d ubiquinol oxidase subunit I|nr:cytochrome ubiquinol oxidase subunit I [Desulfovibrionaceae bacterium]
MDVLLLSRLQFAVATFFHFIFVPLTLGLSVIIALMETKYVRTGDETYKRMAKFWGKLFLINFALGVVTGITLEFQFGTNWSRYSEYVGDIFGSLLAIEASVAFFLESTFLAVWVFGWDKLSPKAHAAAIWLVAIASNLSALWILIANGFMQHPVGYVIRNGRAELESFYDVVFNSFGLQEFLHTVSGSWMLAGFFVMGVSAWHILRKNELDFFNRSFRYGMAFALIFSLFVALQGHTHGNEVAATQPAKLAAMESHWETRKGAPMYLLTVPNPSGEGNLIETLPIPYMLSILAFSDPNAEVVGLNDIPKDERPPVALTFLAFRAMVGLGTLFIVAAGLAWLWRNKLQEKPWFLKALVWIIPLPYIALDAGWTVAEVGRQPWIVYGMMKTADAVSPITTTQAGVSLFAFIAVYSLLGAVDIYLLRKYATLGPEA